MHFRYVIPNYFCSDAFSIAYNFFINKDAYVCVVPLYSLMLLQLKKNCSQCVHFYESCEHCSRSTAFKG